MELGVPLLFDLLHHVLTPPAHRSLDFLVTELFEPNKLHMALVAGSNGLGRMLNPSMRSVNLARNLMS
jgi:hypothetical protein